MVDKNRKYTEQQLAFLDSLFRSDVNGNIRKAMAIAGYSDNVSSISIIRSLRDEILDAAKEVLAAGTPMAVMELFGVLTEPSKLGAGNTIKAAREILDRAGLIKPEDGINLKIPEGGLVILPVKGSKQKVIEDVGVTIDSEVVGETSEE